MHLKTLVVIAGPTAVGKTALAIQVAKHYQTEILSGDSRQFYREMEIGTAKPSLSELQEVKHHFINSHSITENVTVGDYERDALLVLDTIFQKHDIAILVGGSGLFLKAICEGFDQFPDVMPGIREDLNQNLLDFGIVHLQNKLKGLDPAYYSEVDINNPQRVIRALEVSISSGKPYSSFRIQNQISRPFNILKICLNTSREQLYRQINYRVDQMMEVGLLSEVNALIEYQHFNALSTVGYTELFNYIKGNQTLNQSIDLIKQNTRRFAKRQLTWFRKEQDMVWFEPDAKKVIDYLESAINTKPEQ
ncbi:MAG: miaA [Sphingobacteriales bacterium]|nr:miaA [Sphingobacteriales bacterium]